MQANNQALEQVRRHGGSYPCSRSTRLSAGHKGEGVKNSGDFEFMRTGLN